MRRVCSAIRQAAPRQRIVDEGACYTDMRSRQNYKQIKCPFFEIRLFFYNYLFLNNNLCFHRDIPAAAVAGCVRVSETMNARMRRAAGSRFVTGLRERAAVFRGSAVGAPCIR
jgi:hypothetical protein